jgi:hypothetical protein
MKFFGHEEPLGMPRGSVRAMVIILLVLNGIVVQQRGIDLIQAMSSALLLGLGYYFGKRSNGDGGSST